MAEIVGLNLLSRVGVLALQGDYDAHAIKVRALHASPLFVTKASELRGLDALIIPGGESTTFLKLCTKELREELTKRILSGLRTLTTCAGLIFLAKKVDNPSQDSLGLLDIDVERNGYGRQKESFIAPELELTSLGNELIASEMEGVFIRAPRISRVGSRVEVLANHNSEAVLIKQDNIWGASFHPELSDSSLEMYRAFLTQ